MNDEKIKMIQEKLEDIHLDLRDHGETLRSSIADIKEMKNQAGSAADYLSQIAGSLKILTEKMVDGVTGKKQIPQWTHIITICVLGIFILILLLKDSDKDIKISPTSLEFNNH